jgi:hypothetical protein
MKKWILVLLILDCNPDYNPTRCNWLSVKIVILLYVKEFQIVPQLCFALRTKFMKYLSDEREMQFLWFVSRFPNLDVILQKFKKFCPKYLCEIGFFVIETEGSRQSVLRNPPIEHKIPLHLTNTRWSKISIIV